MKAESRLELEWRRGFYCACATMITAHGEDSRVEDVLRCAGKVNFRGIDPYDREALKQTAAELKRKARASAPTPERGAGKDAT